MSVAFTALNLAIQSHGCFFCDVYILVIIDYILSLHELVSGVGFFRISDSCFII